MGISGRVLLTRNLSPVRHVFRTPFIVVNCVQGELCRPQLPLDSQERAFRLGRVTLASRMTTTSDPPQDNPEPGRCNFFLAGRKARFCRSLSVPGQRLCGNHLHVADPHATPAASKRVPCPLDPSHTVLMSELPLHVKRCTALALALRDRVSGTATGGRCRGITRPAPHVLPRTSFPSVKPCCPAP